MSVTTYADGRAIVVNDDCKPTLATLEENSIDSIVTDPPYELGFMGKKWDGTGIAYDVELWEECLRVLKPGGHLLSFGGSRTWHRMAVAIEDAGFELRDSIAWLYGSGFPKSMDVSKAIDKAAGAERAPGVPGRYAARRPRAEVSAVNAYQDGVGGSRSALITKPVTDEAKRWQGWGTGLKPAFEPIVVARKPLAGTVVATVLEHGTGALNIDACRIEAGQDYRDKCASVVGIGSKRNGDTYSEWPGVRTDSSHPSGRWPTNVVLDESQAAELGDSAKFFPVFKYQAKAPSKERPKVDGIAHPTVKPLALVRWLVRLVTPPGGLVLDPFAGSGTTGEAAYLEGFRCLLIEREADYLPLIEHRFNRVSGKAREK